MEKSELKDSVEVALGKRDGTWGKYGIFEAPVLFGTTSKYESNYKAVVKQDKLAAIVSRGYTVIPNEEVLQIIREAGFEPQRVTYGRGGNLMFAELLDERFEGEEVQVGDLVKVGVVVRNSIDGSSSFGADAFTYRLACLNGAVAKGKRFDAIMMRHVGDRAKLIEQFRGNVLDVMEKAADLISFYKTAAIVRLNEELAQKILLAGIPFKYLPPYVTPERDPETGKLRTIVVGEYSLWDTFNDITAKLWHSEKLRMEGIVEHEKALHEVLLEAVK